MNDKNTIHSLLKIPLVVGISGHISIAEDESYVAAQIQAFWKHLRRIIGPETPLVLLSSIARGADHYAVKYRPDDVKYIVILPFKEEEYRKDFDQEEDLINYQNDLTGAYKTIICDAPAGDYSAASDYIRQRSDILLTIWDGRAAVDSSGEPKKGGTYYLINKAFSVDDLLTPEPEKQHLVVNIAVTRKNSTGKNVVKLTSSLDVLNWDEDLSCFCGTPFEEFDPVYESLREDADTYSVITAFNETIAANKALPDSVEKDAWMEADILNSGTDKVQQQEKLNAVMGDFLRYSYYDKIALKHQKRYKHSFIYLLILSGLAALCCQIYGGFTSKFDISEIIQYECLFIYLALSFFLLLYIIYPWKNKDHNIYCSHRVIAELMRLKIFWKLAGFRDDFSSLVLAESGYFFCALPVCNWEICDSVSPSEAINEECHQQMPTVRKAWLKGQLDYYRNTTVPRYLFWEKIMRILSCICYAFSFFFAVSLLVYHCAFRPIDPIKSFLEKIDLSEFIIGLGPLIFASLGWLLEKKQWKDMAKNYSETADYFELTLKKFEKLDKDLQAGDISEEYAIAYRQRLIKELMQLCHEENSEWKKLKADAKPEPMI